MFAFFVLCLVSITIAQPPQPCTSPQQWEAFVYDVNEQESLTVRGQLSYDAINHREHILEEVDIGQQNNSYDRIALFNEKIEYVYDFKANNCTRQPLTRPWRDFAIPPNAQSFGDAYVGSSFVPSGNVLISMWGSNYTTPSNDSVREFGSWTFLHCLPLNIVRYSAQYGRSQITFLNITPNITNPNVFTPRKECLQKNI